MDEIKKNEFRKTDDESFDEYMMRIGNACSERKLTWDQAAVVLNEATNSNFGECAYRKSTNRGKPATTTRLNICAVALWQTSCSG